MNEVAVWRRAASLSCNPTYTSASTLPYRELCGLSRSNSVFAAVVCCPPRELGGGEPKTG